jgi:hypothetical protein
MKSNLRTIVLASLVAIASLSQTLHAQTSFAARVDVPFSFDYGTKHFAHGVYTLSMDGQHTLTLRSNASVATAMVQMSYDPTPTKNSVVVFKKYGDRYFPDEVSIAGVETEIDVFQTREERRAARQLRASGEKPVQVALALLPATPRGN